MIGKDAPYVPGWDCHGLPIELNVEKNMGGEAILLEIKNHLLKLAENMLNLRLIIKEMILFDWEYWVIGRIHIYH